MPYREVEIVERCWVCSVEAGLGCRRCQRPCCPVHVSDHGRCAPCELVQYERTVVRDKVMPLVVAGGIYILMAVGMVGSSAAAFAAAGIAAAVAGGVSLAERNASRRELAPIVTSRRGGVRSS